jgi:acetyl-CoA carboxylase biotin carboxyl carrier protein
MNLDDVKQLLNLAREHQLLELEFEQDGLRLRVRRDGGTVVHEQATRAAAAAPAPIPVAPPAAHPPAVPVPIAPELQGGDVELAVVKSPIVGTFYRSPEPSTPAFVEVGTHVKVGQVLCIVEAMKLMNEIDSEYEGEIVKIYVENGQPVQYGERLFAIRTK